MARRRQTYRGNRYSDRLCSQIARIINYYGEPMTSLDIYKSHVGQWKNNPTRNELSNYLGKSGYFVQMEMDPLSPPVRSAVSLWALEYEKCRARGWFEEPMQNRHVNDPLPLRE